ncbi:MAG TPA: gliding motility-associated C-terminal domain-containing protein [Cyclobacteriaceae bacterium]|nr:gliding motility-associated C-terminal domain-containing protein [Cyclobacteriaceae bacterium]
MKKNWLAVGVFVFLATAVFGQATEICNNGIDDDGDGFIDCFDGDCAGKSVCSGFYLGNDVVCQAKPSKFPQFSMKLKWGSDNQTTNHLNRTSVGDLNRDGIPEVYATEIEGGKIYKLDGKTGKTLKSVSLSGIDREIVIGNINNDNCGQVFVSSGNYIFAYDCNLTLLWKSTQLNGAPAQFGLADFDNDGKIEIYCRDEIVDAHTGVRIVKGTNTASAVGQPIAVDILNNDNQLELISGCNIYTVNLGTRALNSGSLTLQKSVSSFYIRQIQSSTSVADYNLDGNLDVIASGSDGKADDNTTLFFWDVTNNVVKKYIDKISGNVFIAGCTNSSGSYYKNGWQNGTGRVNIADIDGDGKLNATYVSGKYLYALDENWSLKWRVVVNEETSGYTGCTVFDFNGDGAAEVVYRDEQYLYIINGKDGSVNTSQQCIARTNVEYPVVADVDGDGTTELCVTCGFDDKLAWSNFCNLSYSKNSHVRAFQSAGVPWVPSRKAWNQHGYFNVNVNDDLTIPKIMQKSWLVWSTGSCTQGPNRPLNTFLNQTPYMDSKGCPTYASPDLVNVQTLLKVTQPTCPDTDFFIQVGVQNVGDIAINGDVPITFYNGDPTKAGATKLNTVTIPVNLPKNQTATFTGLKVTGTGGNFKLYISLNDAGTSVPTPISLPNSPFVECNYDNVISADVKPKSVRITALKVSDNIKCVGSTVPDNGAARAYVLVSGVENTTDYNFYWYKGAVSGAPVYTGSAYSGLAAGTYSVTALHKIANCNSDTATVTIAQTSNTISASIAVDQPNTSCATPNGQLHAVASGGAPTTTYTYQWYEGNDIFTSPEVGVGSVAQNLKGGKTYTVLVTDNTSGCQAVASRAVPDNSVNPTVTATAIDAFCVPTNSGSTAATVGGSTGGYTFNWYNGSTVKPTADFTGANYNSLTAGSYTVVAIDNTSGCKSSAVTTTVNTPPPFTVTASELTQQTSCNVATPNGSATASIGGVTAGYTFSWFKGMSTAPANAIAGPTNLAAGTYTTQATNTVTGCTATGSATITQLLKYPTLSLAPTPNSTCDPTKGTSQYNGSVVASVTYDGGPVTSPAGPNYSFVWYNGALTTDPVIVGASTGTIAQLNGGSYTLVVTRTDLGCASTPSTAIVKNTPSLPTIATSQTASTNCVVGKEDGVAEVTTVNGVAVGSTSNFIYQWFVGSGTGSPIAGATNAKLQNVQGGAGMNYTVQVTDKTTGCQNTATVLVADAKVNPAITLSKTDNSICNPSLTSPAAVYTGSITTSITNQVGGLSNYTFAFADPGGLTAGGGLPGAPAANIWSQLNGGATSYTVQVTQTSTGCVSSLSSIAVSNNPASLTITTGAIGSTNCTMTTAFANGSSSVTQVNGAPAVATGFVYAWTGPSAPSFPVTNAANNANTKDLINVQGGGSYNYTVVVTRNADGCQATKSVNVPNLKVNPSITLSKVDNTICNSALTSPSVTYNGSVTVSIGNIPAGGSTTDYTYAFTPVGGVQASGATDKKYSQLNGGNYSVTVKQTATGCKSTQSIAVANSPASLTIVTSATGSTNCNLATGFANGLASVTQIDGIPAVATGFVYSWTGPAGFSVNNATNNANTKDLIKVQGGVGYDYSLTVIRNTDGCQVSKAVNVPDSKVNPQLSLTKVDNTICNSALTNPAVAFGGSVTVAIGNIPAGGSSTDYTYAFTPAVGIQTGGATNKKYDQLNGGTYNVTVNQIATGCQSSSSIDVANAPASMTIGSSSTASTSCIAGKENGLAQVTTVDGAPAVASGFVYAWVGPAIFPVTSLANNANTKDLVNVQGGAGFDYTVTVIRNTDGCQVTKAVNVSDGKTLPSVSLSKVDNTICNLTPIGTATNYGGQVNAGAVTYNSAPYALASTLTYNFFNNGTGTGVPAQSNASVSYLNLQSGTYSATVTIDDLGCTSNATPIVVKDIFSYPTVITLISPSTNCVAGKENGETDVTKVDAFTVGVDPQALSNYAYQWFDGNTADPLNSKVGQTSTKLGSTTPGLGIQGGASSVFTVQVTRNSDGCQTDATTTITNAKANPKVKLTVTKNNTICDESAFTPDGSLHATVTYKGITQPSPLAANWVLSWASATDNLGALTAGSYPVSVMDTNTGCTSSTASGVIINQFDYPVPSTSVISKQTSCDPLLPNGQLQGSATDGPAGSTLKYNWYQGIGTGGTSVNAATGQASGAPLSTPANLVSDNYTFSIYNEVTGCAATQTIFLPQQQALPTFTGAVTDVTTCVPTNGELQITLTSITNNNKFRIYYLNEVNKAHTSDPSIIKTTATAFYENDPTKLVYDGILVGHQLVPGTYTVLVRDSISHCQSNPQTFTVKDNTKKTVTASLVASATFCNSGTGGKLDLTVNPVIGPPGYTYKWYAGVATNSGFNFMNNAVLPTFAGGVLQTSEDLDGTTDLVHTGVTNGVYSVVVTDPVGCGKVFSDNVPFIGAPDITVTPVNSTKCDPALSDAKIQISVASNAGVVAGTKYAMRLITTQNSATGTWVNGERTYTLDEDGDTKLGATDPYCFVLATNTPASTATATFTATAPFLTGGTAQVLLGDYVVQIIDQTLGSGCSLDKVVTLDIDPKLPDVAVVSTPSSVCTGGVGDATVQLTVSKDATDPTTPNYGLTAISPANISGPAFPQALATGVPTMVTGTFNAITYKFSIVDAVSGCSLDQIVNVPGQPEIPTIVAAPTGDAYCSPATNGSALIATVTTPSPSLFSDFKFEWYKDNALAALIYQAIGNGAGAPGNQGELINQTHATAGTPGNYWPIGAIAGLGNPSRTFFVRAQKQGGKGDHCYSQIQQVTIADTHSTPDLVLSPFSDTSCSGTAEGRIEVTASTTSSDATIQNSTYTYSWAPDPNTASPVAGQSGPVPYKILALPTNTYTVTGLNETSKCTVQQNATVLNTKFDIEITNKLVTDQVKCPIDGEIDVTEISIDRSITGESTLVYNGATLTNEFTYQWFNATPGNAGTFNSATPINDAVPTPITVVSLVAGNGVQQNQAMGTGTYYVIATRKNTNTIPGAGCSSNPIRVDVGDQRVFPTVSFSTVPSTACDNNFDGQITVTATTAGSPGATYNFQWTNDPDGLGGVLYSASNSATNNTASPFTTKNTDLIGAQTAAFANPYTVRVTNFTTGCFTDANTAVIKKTIPMSITGVTPTNRDLCSSLNGKGQVNGIAETPGPGNVANYTYLWSTGASTGLGVTTLAGLDFGTYTVVATKKAVPVPIGIPGVNGSGCSTAPATFVVLDKRVNPTVSFATVSSTSCDNNFDGQITVTATTASGPGAGSTYNFQWQNDPDGLGVLYSASDSPTANTASPFTTKNTDLIGPETAVFTNPYTVKVTNFVTGCSTTANAQVTQKTLPMSITGVTPTHRDLCSSLNGKGQVTTISETPGPGNTANYSYAWSTGASTGLGVTTLSGLDFGTYTVVATKKAVPGPIGTPGVNGSSCSTAPATFVVLDKRVDPTISFATVSNTSCDNNFDGQITVTATTASGPGVGATYNFQWLSDPDGVGVLYSASDSPTANTASPFSTKNTDLIGPQTNVFTNPYTVKVTNFVTGCFAMSDVEVTQKNITMSISSVTSTDVTLCSSNNGSGTVVTIAETPGPGLTGNYTYTWDDDPLMASPFATNTVPAAGLTQNNLDVGTYYVTAKKNAVVAPIATPGVNGSSCVTAPAAFVVLDKRVKPTVSFTSVDNSSCDNNFDGQIKVTATTASGPGSAVGVGYNFVWSSDPDGVGALYSASNSPTVNTLSPFSTLNTDKVGPQTSVFTNPYTVRVTNFATGCFRDASVQVNQGVIPMRITGVNAQDVTLCSPLTPDGAGTITGMTETPGPGLTANYKYTWSMSPTMLPTFGIVDDPLLTRGSLAAGLYYVTAKRNAVVSPLVPGVTGSGCVTAPAEFEVKDVHVDPTVAAAVINPDVNCAGGSGAGKIALSEVSPLSYTFSWFSGDDISGAPVASTGVNGEVIQNLQEGDYTVQMTSNITKCKTIKSFTVQNNPTIVAFDPSGFSAPAVGSCNLATGLPLNGSATIATILENNVSQPITNYTFVWKDASGSVLQSGSTNVLNNIPIGSYFVTATSSASNCAVDLSFKIDDQTVGTTTVTLVSFQQPERCITPQSGLLLTVQGGGSGATFSYEWYPGDQRTPFPPGPTGVPISNSSSLNNISVPPGQTSVTYTIKTINNSNNCWALDAYTLPLIVNPVVITASATPLTFCSSNNGEVFSTIVNDNKFKYDFYWTTGATPKVPPASDFTGNQVTNLPVGTYTVIAVDKSDTGCVSPPFTVVIDNEQAIPVVTARVLQDLTICDPARPDGSASADVAGDFIHYTFDWFAGASTSGTSFYTGPEVGGLAATQYSVLAKDKTTGCSSSATVTVKGNFALIPNPTVVVVSDVTSCVSPDGELSASVNGVTKDYIFDWAIGTNAPPPVSFTGEYYKNLDEGQYTVVATSKITGCKSGPATGPIAVKQIFPEVAFLLQDASCPPPPNSPISANYKPNGFITLLVNNNLPIETITWYADPSLVVMGEGPNLQEVGAGSYRVKVVTTKGCEKDFPVVLPVEITVYNGISFRADGMNDYFHIGCIDNFDRNHVEIFNRAGTKVYEADGYNNSNIKFDGKSNQGISLMGTNLPTGTYFYVITKGDGSKRLAGYLELVE